MRQSISLWLAYLQRGVASVSRRSPNRARSTLTFLLISEGSISKWIFLALGVVGFNVAGDTVVKTHPKSQDQVGCWMALLTQASPCMPIMPRLRGWLAGKAPNPSRVMATGVILSANSFNSLHGSAQQHTLACQDHRLLGRIDHFDRLLEALRQWTQIGAIPRQPDRAQVIGPFHAGLLNILGNIYQDRAGTARFGQCKMLPAWSVPVPQHRSPGNCAW